MLEEFVFLLHDGGADGFVELRRGFLSDLVVEALGEGGVALSVEVDAVGGLGRFLVLGSWFLVGEHIRKSHSFGFRHFFHGVGIELDLGVEVVVRLFRSGGAHENDARLGGAVVAMAL